MLPPACPAAVHGGTDSAQIECGHFLIDSESATMYCLKHCLLLDRESLNFASSMSTQANKCGSARIRSMTGYPKRRVRKLTHLTYWRIKMNAKQLIAAVVVFAATGAAFAQSSEYVTPNENFVSTKTRAEVKAEIKQAYVEGTLAQRDGEDTARVAGNRVRQQAPSEVTQQAKAKRLPADVTDTYFGG